MGCGRVTAPTVVIHGLIDPLVRPDGGIATAQAVPGARLVMYPDMGARPAAAAVDADHRRDRRDQPAARRWLNPAASGGDPAS